MSQLDAKAIDKMAMDETAKYREKLYADYGMKDALKEDAIELEEVLGWQIDGFDDGFVCAAESLMEWRSAKAVPPTGTLGLVYGEEAATKQPLILRAVYSDGTDLECAKGAEEGGYYDKKRKLHLCVPGWYEWNHFDKIHYKVTFDPTHWMKMPPAPKAEAPTVAIQRGANDLFEDVGMLE